MVLKIVEWGPARNRLTQQVHQQEMNERTKERRWDATAVGLLIDNAFLLVFLLKE